MRNPQKSRTIRELRCFLKYITGGFRIMVLGFKCSDLSYLFSEVTALVLYTLFHTKWEVQYISDWEGRLTCNLYACWWSYNTTYVSKRVFILTMQYQAGLHRISFTRIYFSHQIKFTYLNFTKSVLKVKFGFLKEGIFLRMSISQDILTEFYLLIVLLYLYFF